MKKKIKYTNGKVEKTNFGIIVRDKIENLRV